MQQPAVLLQSLACNHLLTAACAAICHDKYRTTSAASLASSHGCYFCCKVWLAIIVPLQAFANLQPQQPRHLQRPLQLQLLRLLLQQLLHGDAVIQDVLLVQQAYLQAAAAAAAAAAAVAAGVQGDLNAEQLGE
jgi:hypothetical protein